MKLGLITASCLILLTITVPAVGAVVCGVLLVFQLTLMFLRPVISKLPTPAIRNPTDMAAPVFSVHVATHSEPPEMVIRTLKALIGQRWDPDGFEIIVMDNNTSDPALWRPVEAFCAAQGGNLKFLHRTDVHEAKAGALNIALDHSRPDASHIVTVDADYVVSANFLSSAAAALERTGADYVQFPQSYSGASISAAGVNAELEEYFSSNAAVADEAEAVLLTGTLCVISKDALIAAGGWSGATTTEDAEMGVRLCKAGFTGRFINKIVGQGVLPLSLFDLEQQRYRWCSGNCQTLTTHFAAIMLTNGSMSLPKRLVIVSQLTAWFNLALLPAFVLITVVLTGKGESLAGLLAASVIILVLADAVLRICGRGIRDRLGVCVTTRAIACRLALAPRSAIATFDALIGKDLTFNVTDKIGSDPSRGASIPIVQLVLFITSLVIFLGVLPTNALIVVALLSLMLPFPAALVTDSSLRTYRKSFSARFQEVTS